MNVKQLRFISVIAECGSVSQAAISLAIPQPNLSRQLNKFEEELGVQLFHRHGRGVTLTLAGERFLYHTKAALKHIENAEKELQSLVAQPQDITVIGFPPTVARLLSVPLAMKFQQVFPLAHLRIEEAYSGLLLEWLGIGKVDIAVIYKGPNSTNILGDKLTTERLYLVGSKGSHISALPEISGHELAKLPLILPTHPHGLRRLLEQKAQQAKITLNVTMEINDLRATLALVGSRDANIYTILPYNAVREEIDKGQLTVSKIVQPAVSRSLILASTSHKPTSATTRKVLKMVRELSDDLLIEGI